MGWSMDCQGIRTLFDRVTGRLSNSNCRDHAESGLVSTRIQTNSPPAMPNFVKKRANGGSRWGLNAEVITAQTV